MRGTNPVANARSRDEGYLVKEVFYTIQGEGPWAGMPAIFLRFAECNLRCAWCDTDFEGGEHHNTTSLSQTVRALAKETNCRRIVLTGGEPMLYDLPRLIEALGGDMFVFQVETAGTVWPENLTHAMRKAPILIVCSPKTSKVHELVAEHTHFWKYIIKAGEVDENDGLPTAWTQVGVQNAPSVRAVYRAHRNSGTIFVQPMDEGDPAKNEANLKEAARSALKYGYRLSVQVHKLAGLP